MIENEFVRMYWLQEKASLDVELKLKRTPVLRREFG